MKIDKLYPYGFEKPGGIKFSLPDTAAGVEM
jgi:hypothetical protein